MTASDVQKILDLKRTWEFIPDQDVIQAKSDYYVLCNIAHGQGFLVIPEAHVAEFKKLLVAYYEGEDEGIIQNWLSVSHLIK